METQLDKVDMYIRTSHKWESVFLISAFIVTFYRQPVYVVYTRHLTIEILHFLLHPYAISISESVTSWSGHYDALKT